MKTTIKIPAKGDQYISTNSEMFEVTNIFMMNGEVEPWVEYMNTKSKQQYTCKQGAFLARFTHRVA